MAALTPEELMALLARADRLVIEARALSAESTLRMVQARADDRGVPQPLGPRKRDRRR